MKKTLYVIMTFTIMLSVFIGCRENRTAVQNTDGRINVIATVFPSFDFVRQIAGDRVNLTMLLPPGSESHSFEPSPRDIIAIQNSDLFIYIGGNSDEWAERILKSMNTDTMNILAIMDTVETLEEEIVEGMEDPHHHEEHHHGFFYNLFLPIIRLFGHEEYHHNEEIVLDEHVWTSPKNSLLIIQAITDMLIELDPANAYFYKQNATAYIEDLQELDAAFEEVIAQANRRTIVFGDRFPFRYFAHDYGLEYFAAFPGCSTETEPSAATVAFLINKIRAEQIPVVFHIELSNERMADTISGETGARKLLFHAAHNITRNDFDAGLTYIEIMQRNVENLRQALH